ncbi:MAG: DUF2844 domain-containing protein [Proteobacteria bacterium]|nr:DUF2844 domain-containing protein [Pseudomonadota bacterium]
MDIAARRTHRSASRRALSRTVALAALLATTSAWAGLGEPVASVARDHAALHGTALNSAASAGYEMHESVLADGTRVRQYAVPGGRVFAVSWQGRQLPDLKVLLASHYDAYVAAARAHVGGHHVFSLATPDVAMYVMRRSRDVEGSAHVPALVPAGVAVAELH